MCLSMGVIELKPSRNALLAPPENSQSLPAGSIPSKRCWATRETVTAIGDGASGTAMRAKFSVWSDYGTPSQRHWMSASKRGTRTSIGPMILLAAVVVVAGVIGISGIYPQIIDAEWVQDTSILLPKMSLSNPHATRKRSNVVAAIPLGAVTTGEAAVSSRAAPAPELSPVAGRKPPEETAELLAVAAIPNAEAEASAAKAAPSKLANKSKAAKKKVVRVEHRQRGYSGTYARYGGSWSGWAGGGLSGFQPIGNYRRF
jgi:hypothetical protein